MPPVAVSVVNCPEQMVVVPSIFIGAVGGVFTVTVTVAQLVVVVLQGEVPTRRTQ